MATWAVTVDGTSVDALVDVQPEEADENELARAKITVGNTANNRTISSADAVVIQKNGSTVMEGNITKRPTKEEGGQFLELTAADKRVELQKQEVHRPFINMDSGDIIKESLNKRAEVRNSVIIHQGEGPGSDWSHDLPVFELADFSSKRYREYGSNLVFCGWRTGAAGTYTATYSGVPSSAIPGTGQISRLKTRLLANNTGDQIQGEVELKDNNGKRWIWSLPQLSNNFETYELRAEDAKQSASIGSAASGSGVLEYRFFLKGELAEPRAVLIDHAETLPFALRDRTTNITDTDVQTTGRSITRRFDATLMEMLKELGHEDGFMSYVDSDDHLHYEPSGQADAPKSIDFNGGTPVVSASNEKDYDRIINKLTVVGSGDIQVTLSNQASISFYGLSEREDQLVDKEIQTNAEAKSRGEGEMVPWHDSALKFEVADESYSDVRVGESMQIKWDPFDVDGEFIVSGKEVQPSGIVKLSFTGHTG